MRAGRPRLKDAPFPGPPFDRTRFVSANPFRGGKRSGGLTSGRNRHDIADLGRTSNDPAPALDPMPSTVTHRNLPGENRRKDESR